MSWTSEDIVLEDHGRQLAIVAMVLPTGCVQDPPGKEGLAYLTGQMLARGAGKLSYDQIIDELDFLGSRLTLNVSRTTTSVGGDALTRNLDAFEELVAMLLGEPTFPAAELEKLKRQTIAELAQIMENDAAVGQRFFLRALFDGHQYGRPVKGTPQTIGGITRDDIVAFFEANYRSGRVLLGAAGDIDAARAAGFRERTAARLPDGKPADPEIGPAPVGEGYRLTLVDKPERSQTQVFIGHPTVDANHPDFLPLLVGQTVFGGTFTARLSREIREKRGWSYGAYSYLGVDRHLGTLTIRFYPATEDTLPALEVADQLFVDLRDEGVSEAEADFAKRYLINSHPFSVDTVAKRLHEEVMLRLQGRPGDWIERYTERIAAVELDAVNEALRRHMTPDDVTVAVVATAKDLEAKLRDWPRTVEVQTVDYRDY